MDCKDREITNDIGNQLLQKRIRLLKTGLFAVDRYLDMSLPENQSYFEQLAVPGTELRLARRHDNPDNPYRIDVYSMDGQYLGRVTQGKDQTVARLIDAGFEIVAVVNESLPFHDSDYNFGIKEKEDDTGWSETTRAENAHSRCNLPYGIYLVDP